MLSLTVLQIALFFERRYYRLSPIIMAFYLTMKGDAILTEIRLFRRIGTDDLL